jgi:hypothetical protein
MPITTDLSSSLFHFQKYLAENKKEEKLVKIYVPQTTPTIHPTGEIDWKDIPDEPAVIPAAYAGDTNRYF